jgi:hypothetical protein
LNNVATAQYTAINNALAREEYNFSQRTINFREYCQYMGNAFQKLRAASDDLGLQLKSQAQLMPVLTTIGSIRKDVGDQQD